MYDSCVGWAIVMCEVIVIIFATISAVDCFNENIPAFCEYYNIFLRSTADRNSC